MLVHSPARAFAFDLGDTLVEYEGFPLSWEPHYPDALRNLAAFLQVDVTDKALEKACAVLRRFNTRLQPRETEVSFSTILRDLVVCLGRSDPVDELAGATAFFKIFRQRLRCFDDTRPALASLRQKRMKIGVFTDVPYGMPTALVREDLREAGLADAFDALLTSRDAGYRKPAATSLRALAAALQCGPTEMVYVGNERKDIEAARAFGCQSVLLVRSGDAPAWGQDRTIRSLTEL
jgi:putative hydrolase of the HAD superfamily